MSNQQIVMQIVSDHLQNTPPKISPELRFFDDLGADSIDHVEIIMLIEEKFKIQISDDEMDKLITVEDFINIVNLKTQEKEK